MRNSVREKIKYVCYVKREFINLQKKKKGAKEFALK